MLLRYWDAILQNPKLGLIVLVVGLGTLVASLVVHEFSHAFVSMALGDTTQRKRGRLSLNPLRHLDPVGTLLLLFAGFGWAKPVQTDARYLKPNPDVGMALVGAAGPAANLLLAFLAALPYRLHLYTFFTPFEDDLSLEGILRLVMFSVISLNIILAVFNLIPIPPLDGSWVARLLLPKNVRNGRIYAQITQYGMLFFILLMGLSWYTGGSVLGRILDVPVRFLSSIIVGQTVRI